MSVKIVNSDICHTYVAHLPCVRGGGVDCGMDYLGSVVEWAAYVGGVMLALFILSVPFSLAGVSDDLLRLLVLIAGLLAGTVLYRRSRLGAGNTGVGR